MRRIDPVGKGLYVGGHVTVVAGEEVINRAVLGIGYNRSRLCPGIDLVAIKKIAKLIRLIDNAGSTSHSGDHLVRPIDRAVRLVPEMSVFSMAHHGGIRIGRGDVPVVQRGTGMFLQSLLQFVIRDIEATSFYH